MKKTEIEKLINSHESDTLEFKKKVENSLARDISAMANTKGGIILIGVADNGEVVGASKKDEEKLADILSSLFPRIDAKVGWIQIDGRNILRITVPKSDKVISAGGIVYIRVGSTNRPLDITEMLERAGENLIVSFDLMENPYATVEEVNWEIVKKYLERRYQIRKIPIPKESKRKILEMLNIIGRKNKRITNGGHLFFTDYPQRIFPYVTIRILEFSSSSRDNVVDDRIIEDNLWKMFDEATGYLKEKLNKGFYIKGMERIEDYEIPLEMIREGIANAIIHRNYLSTGNIRIEIFNDRVEIINPGSFPLGVTPNHPIHKPRNPLIARYFFDIGIVEKYGSGIYRMIRIAQERHTNP